MQTQNVSMNCAFSGVQPEIDLQLFLECRGHCYVPLLYSILCCPENEIRKARSYTRLYPKVSGLGR
jgi:hypothetical protein